MLKAKGTSSVGYLEGMANQGMSLFDFIIRVVVQASVNRKQQQSF